MEKFLPAAGRPCRCHRSIFRNPSTSIRSRPSFSIKYDDDVRAVLEDARRWMDARASQVKNPAIVLDIDETSLSNWTRIQRDDFGYIPNGSCDLAKSGEACGTTPGSGAHKRPAIGPTLELFDRAGCKGAAPGAACGRATWSGR